MRNYDVVSDVVAALVRLIQGRIAAKRLLPEARAAGYHGSARNFRRLVARAKRVAGRPPPGPGPGRVVAR